MRFGSSASDSTHCGASKYCEITKNDPLGPPKSIANQSKSPVGPPLERPGAPRFASGRHQTSKMRMVWVIKRQRCGQDGVPGHLDGGLAVVGWSTLRHARGLREGGEGKPSEQGVRKDQGPCVPHAPLKGRRIQSLRAFRRAGSYGDDFHDFVNFSMTKKLWKRELQQ